MSKKLVISLFGEGISVRKIDFSKIDFQEMKMFSKRYQKPIEVLLIDPFFYNILRNNKIKSINDVSYCVLEGLIDTPTNQIELWHCRNKLMKLKISDLNNSSFLFPIYTIVSWPKYEFLEKGYYYIEKRVGLIEKKEAIVEDFKIDDLKYDLTTFDDNKVLIGVCLKSVEMRIVKEDYVITYQNIIFVK